MRYFRMNVRPSTNGDWRKFPSWTCPYSPWHLPSSDRLRRGIDGLATGMYEYLVVSPVREWKGQRCGMEQMHFNSVRCDAVWLRLRSRFRRPAARSCARNERGVVWLIGAASRAASPCRFASLARSKPEAPKWAFSWLIYGYGVFSVLESRYLPYHETSKFTPHVRIVADSE